MLASGCSGKKIVRGLKLNYVEYILIKRKYYQENQKWSQPQRFNFLLTCTLLWTILFFHQNTLCWVQPPWFNRHLQRNKRNSRAERVNWGERPWGRSMRGTSWHFLPAHFTFISNYFVVFRSSSGVFWVYFALFRTISGEGVRTSSQVISPSERFV